MSRLRIPALLAALALAATLAACGGGGSDDPQQVVEEATLKGVQSGQIDLSLGIDVKGKKSGHVDVELSGPFEGEEGDELPDLDLTASAKGGVGGQKVDFEGGLTVLGNRAYVDYEGTEYEVDPTTFNFIRATFRQQGRGADRSAEATACQEAASELEFGNFLENLSETSEAEVGGESTTKVSGDVNAGGAIDALTELSEDPACSAQLKAAGPLPSPAELSQSKGTVEDSLKDAHVDLYVGDDHIIRRVVARLKIEPPKGSVEGGAREVDVEFDMSLTGVDEEQEISAPQGSRPLNELFLKLGVNPIELLGLLQGGGAGGLGGPGGLNGLLEGLGSGSTQ